MAMQHCPTLLLHPALLTAWLALRGPAEELGGKQAGLMTLLGGTTQHCLGFLPAVAISPWPGRKRKLQWCGKSSCKPWHCTRVGHGEPGGIFQFYFQWFQRTPVSLPCCLVMNVSVPERGTQGAAAANVPGPAPGQSFDLHSPDGWTEPQQVTIWAITSHPSIPSESCIVVSFLPQLSSSPFFDS